MFDGGRFRHDARSSPSHSVTAEWSAVLSGGALAFSAVRSDQLHTAVTEPLAEWIAIGSPVVDQSRWDVRSDSPIEQRPDQRDLGRIGAVDIDDQRQAGSIDQEHEIGALATLGRTGEIAPFSAEANVPSAKPCAQSMSTCRSQPTPRLVPHAVVGPFDKASPTSDVRGERPRQVFAPRTASKHPQDAFQAASHVGHWVTAPRSGCQHFEKIRDQQQLPVRQLRLRKIRVGFHTAPACRRDRTRFRRHLSSSDTQLHSKTFS
jgi:hypothetical protein